MLTKSSTPSLTAGAIELASIGSAPPTLHFTLTRPLVTALMSSAIFCRPMFTGLAGAA